VSESTVTAKGQTTVPAEIREKANVTTGSRLVWHVLPDGTILVRAKSRSIMDLAGSLKAPAGRHVRIEQMNAWK
jgi:AbrB family looped-hinge helix DNA binding protein